MGQLSLPFTEIIPGYRFVVTVGGLLLGFRKITGVSCEIETETYHEGGLNTAVHVFPKYCRGERILTMEKGVCGGAEHPFCTVGQRIGGTLDLIVLDGRGLPLKNYLFTGLLIKKWEVGELSAEHNGLLINRFEVSYEDFQVIA
ncbi:MAG: phage tail protein [Lachnospiraceae bacterium]|nr:phage tail protein [Lachnospiraceae bacterium]